MSMWLFVGNATFIALDNIERHCQQFKELMFKVLVKHFIETMYLTISWNQAITIMVFCTW